MLPTDATERKNIPVYTGFMCFFPLGIAEVALHSHVSTEQHHPGEPCHWDKSKSTDEKDSQARHLLDQTFPEQSLEEQILHARAGAWRAMANLERLCMQRPQAPLDSTLVACPKDVFEKSNPKKIAEPKWVEQGEYWSVLSKETVEEFRARTGGPSPHAKSTRQAPRSNV